MLIWLPPSEGKMAPEAGPVLDLGTLLFPELAEARGEVMGALRSLGDGPEAAAVLGLGVKSSADAAHNLALEAAPCAPAIELFTGVLYDALDAATLDAESRARLDRHAWIMSALFGVVRPSDPIPNHRLAMGVSLPSLGGMAAWWRGRLGPLLVGGLAGETIVDCRPGAYRAAYPAAESHVVEIGVVEERAAGRKVITHMAKRWRGIVARHLVQIPGIEGADLSGVLALIEGLTERPEILSIEIAPARVMRAGGTTTRVTLVTASTEA